MREILFRGKNKLNGDWIYGDLRNYEKSGAKAIFSHELLFRVEVDPATVGQFTGLTDKNGKRIFEGDILKSDDIIHKGEIQIPGEIYRVDMQKGCWVVVAADTAWDFLCTNVRNCSVIGNIHDNPELLEGAG